jgi:hypothetical protein
MAKIKTHPPPSEIDHPDQEFKRVRNEASGQRIARTNANRQAGGLSYIALVVGISRSFSPSAGASKNKPILGIGWEVYRLYQIPITFHQRPPTTSQMTRLMTPVSAPNFHHVPSST